MYKHKSLADRKADQSKEREKRTKLVRKIAAKSSVSKKIKAKSTPQTSVSSISSAQPSRPHRPWAQVRSGYAHLAYQARTSNEFIAQQPWTHGIVSTFLKAADEGCITLCLIWPDKVTSLSLVHALANIERVFARDLRGIRTLLYPGTHACRAPLHSVLADRQALSEFYRNLWVHKENGLTEPEVCTRSPAFLAALGALNDITLNDPELSNPSLAELIPTFVFEQTKRTWRTTVANPLERTLSKVERLVRRRDLRHTVSLEWAVPDLAPGALMVMHHTTTKEAWRTALASTALKGEGKPEVLLINATQAATNTNYSTIKRIPDFLVFARENGFTDTGGIIITDDPKIFFVLRKKFHDIKLTFSTKVWAAESDEGLLSANPVTMDWQPAQRSNSNFNVSIVDRDASHLALEFQRLAQSAGNEDSMAHHALIQACIYILRLSNMPAGYTDLTAASAETAELDYSSQQNSWTPVRLLIDTSLASGSLNQIRDSVERTVTKAEQLIDDWNDATPMASRMLAEIRKQVVEKKHEISLVLPNNRYIQLVHHFLERKMGDDWSTVKSRIEWHTLSAIGKTYKNDRRGKHSIFVGINHDALRILVSHQYIPHGTVVLVAYQRAESTLKTLAGMKEVEEFKAYRGRIGLLAQELERRLAEMPNPLVIGKLHEMSLTFKFDENRHNSHSGEQAYTRFELEGGGLAYASGWVYRYMPDEDPPFRRTSSSKIESGDFIFEMSDELRAKIESLLQLNDDGDSSVVNPVRSLLKLYHDDVQRRCELHFKSTKRSVLARDIYAKMIELDPKAKECRQGRVYYWLSLQTNADTRPHASRDAIFFKLFCRALGIRDEYVEQYWGVVRYARRLNQYLGRELVARYAEILFQPESAAAYRKVPEEIILTLQQEALNCVYRVERVVPPEHVSTNMKGETSANPQ